MLSASRSNIRKGQYDQGGRCSPPPPYRATRGKHVLATLATPEDDPRPEIVEKSNSLEESGENSLVNLEVLLTIEDETDEAYVLELLGFPDHRTQRYLGGLFDRVAENTG